MICKCTAIMKSLTLVYNAYEKSCEEYFYCLNCGRVFYSGLLRSGENISYWIEPEYLKRKSDSEKQVI